LRADSYL
jgi:hypothetical protein